MKKHWYDDIYNLINKAALVKLPFEILHFPSTGITSAINRYAEQLRNGPESNLKIIVIDLRAGNFNQDRNHNKSELLRILVSQLEQCIDERISFGEDVNIYKIIQTIIQPFAAENKQVLFIFYQSYQLNIIDLPEYCDILLFLYKLSDSNNGLVNIVLASTKPEFDSMHPAPFPIISKYYGYYDSGKAFRTINEDILTNTGFKRHSTDDVLKLVEISGGLAAIVKALARDLLLQEKKLNTIYTLKFDSDFFQEFDNTRIVVERLVQKLHPEYINALLDIVKGSNKPIEPSTLEHLRKVNILDENDNVRGIILPSYLNLYCSYSFTQKDMETARPNILNTILPEEISYKPEAESITKNFHQINTVLKIDSLTGEIYLSDKAQNEFLTTQELAAFQLLFENANSDISREEIAKVIWGEKALVNYSDWAIDKLISRIREKLNDNKPYRVIQTVRNRGFVIRTSALIGSESARQLQQLPP